jgi:hypothetical protein
MWTCTKAQIIGWTARPTALLPVHADQVLLMCFGAADEYVNRNNSEVKIAFIIAQKEIM